MVVDHSGHANHCSFHLAGSLLKGSAEGVYEGIGVIVEAEYDLLVVDATLEGNQGDPHTGAAKVAG